MNSKIKRVAEIIAEAILRKKISKVLVTTLSVRKTQNNIQIEIISQFYMHSPLGFVKLLEYKH